ncbi:hypothetical protein [Stenotrophomonas sp. 24(2023)]|uniref:hypothetical protein n=1 Tax=Stenotrophomonas sp. 24(2023) TaxID=3068324 RepID=UPI0027DF8D49|nr:hypothetical protein [Stenotrophomonas sp. 24(2023)]WMJ69238.1 hypothetical protein Q9R17_19010 [Stenotrophomonas sp. 24(2023)]
MLALDCLLVLAAALMALPGIVTLLLRLLALLGCHQLGQFVRRRRRGLRHLLARLGRR